jgi:5'-deoxynucleotidase YfbR-like HD superfamily hydrolase
MPVWQKMLSGRRLDLLNPSAIDIEIEDIAHGLSRVVRWSGQTAGDHGFSVAQHGLLVEEIARNLQPAADKAWLMASLLHDAPEYVTGDMSKPVKEIAGVDYGSFEERLRQAVHIRFGLPAIITPQLRKFIKRADKIAAYIEATQVAGFSDLEARKLFGPPPVTLKDWHIAALQPNDARHLYLRRFEELSNEMSEAAAA